MMPLVVITGVSSGIGRACVHRFGREGWKVIGTIRSCDTCQEDFAEYDFALEYVEFDDRSQVRQAAEAIQAKHGIPDVLVNNAGMVLYGSVEDLEADDVARLYEVNVFSQVEFTKGFLPKMRARGSGVIANVTSLGGRLVFPFFGVYNSSKHALEGLSEALWYELRPFGIRVKAIEPGFVETPIYDKSMKSEGAQREGSEAYSQYQEAMTAFTDRIARRTTPAEAADELYDAVMDPSDKLRYPIAAYARPLILARRLFGELPVMRLLYRRMFGQA